MYQKISRNHFGNIKQSNALRTYTVYHTVRVKRILNPSREKIICLTVRNMQLLVLKRRKGRKKESEGRVGEADGDNRNSLPPAFLSSAMIASEAEK